MFVKSLPVDIWFFTLPQLIPLKSKTRLSKYLLNNGNFDSIGNLQTTADAFQTQESNSGPVVIGRENVTTVKDTDGTMHDVTDAATLKVMLDQGMTIVSVKTVNITG